MNCCASQNYRDALAAGERSFGSAWAEAPGWPAGRRAWWVPRSSRPRRHPRVRRRRRNMRGGAQYARKRKIRRSSIAWPVNSISALYRHHIIVITMC